MPRASALDDLMATALDRVETADIVVGIPSYKNAATIGHVVRTVVEGLRTSFAHMRAVVVNADGGSNDGTPDVVREALGGMRSVVGAYVGPPGKGSAFRAIFQTASALGVSACAVVDSDLRSITPQWIERLIRPVVSGRAGYITPLYARHKHDGTITNQVAYPLTRALYGARVRQPIGGEFGFAGDLVPAFLEGVALGGGDVWEGDVARFGIDIYMTTTALVRGTPLAQAYLGAKVHDPKDPGADLGPMFRQVVGTAFRLAAVNVDRWWDVNSSRDLPVVGDAGTVEPEEVRADSALLVRRLREGEAEHGATWRESLSDASLAAVRRALGEDIPHSLTGTPWARLVYDLLASSAAKPARTDAYVTAMVPLYFGRVAAFIDDARDLTSTGSERLVEEQAAAFEAEKPYLRERWPAT